MSPGSRIDTQGDTQGDGSGPYGDWVVRSRGWTGHGTVSGGEWVGGWITQRGVTGRHFNEFVLSFEEGTLVSQWTRRTMMFRTGGAGDGQVRQGFTFGVHRDVLYDTGGGGPSLRSLIIRRQVV